MKKKILLIFLWIARVCGLFALSRRLTAKDLRILCYHGAALRDEHRFSPGLFMSGESFTKRLDHLAQKSYPVIGLEQAVAGLEQGNWPRCATVITIDDGWYGTYTVMGPALRRHGFASTLYLCTYYLEKQTQVFNVAANYVLWRAQGKSLDLSLLSGGMTGSFEMADDSQRAEARRRLDARAETLEDAAARQALFRRLCQALDLNWAAVEDERICTFMTGEEARALRDSGVDLQLHTHRHRFGAQRFEQAEKEINDNRRVLKPLTDRPLRHFCYPSGDYEKDQLAWLERLDIASATTTQGGFNRPGSSPFELRRFLDAERVSPLEFEAEMSGFFELIRRCGYAI